MCVYTDSCTVSLLVTHVFVTVYRQGEYWKTSRRSLSSKLMKPNSVVEYLADVNAVTAEFIDRLRLLKAQRQDGASVGELTFEINKYTMEGKGRSQWKTTVSDSLKAKSHIYVEGTIYNIYTCI